MRDPKDKGDRQRRFKKHYPALSVRVINSEAIRQGRSMWFKRVVQPKDSPRLLVSGYNNMKLGRIVDKGKWKSFPIYHLTLEERATCSSTCHMWNTCYGNSMSRARRHVHGAALEDKLEKELSELQWKHPKGFVVRLHTLGDFYSTEYAWQWRWWLHQFPALHVFGYTQRSHADPIGAVVHQTSRDMWDRFAIRWSVPPSLAFGLCDGWPMQGMAVVRQPGEKAGDGQFPCPAQLNDRHCCGTCTACWTSKKTVSFIGHGKQVRKGKRQEQEEAVVV